jgi:hypothetical protein
MGLRQPYLLHSFDYSDRYVEELRAFQEVFGEERTGVNVAAIPSEALVIPRFRSIPFGRELQFAVESQGATLINSFSQHRAVADLFSWVEKLGSLTPTAYRLEDIPTLSEGEYFVKGETNSLKDRWFESAYVPSKSELLRVVRNVQGDQYVGGQELVIRPFQHYRKLLDGVDGRPIFHERRAFFYKGELLTSAFYWSSYPEALPVADVQEECFLRAVHEAIARVGDVAPFLVIDFAEYTDGNWGVVELNDACMSGLSDNVPVELWQALQNKLAECA